MIPTLDHATLRNPSASALKICSECEPGPQFMSDNFDRPVLTMGGCFLLQDNFGLTTNSEFGLILL